MASTPNQQQPFQAVPPSLSAGDHELRDYYAQQDAPRPTMNQTPYLTPYLGFRARLSQILINRWTILLLLVLVRLLFAVANTEDSLASARREALSACTQVENIGSSMASMPHYMAQGVNDMTASGVEKAVSGLMHMLEMSVTGVEEIVLFVIHMMTSTYLCLITLAIRGSVGAAVEIGTEMAQALNKTVDEVTGDIGDATKKVTDAINSVFSKMPDIPFTPGFEVPQINLDEQINKLKALQVPPKVQEDLQKLNQSIPTFEEVQNFTDSVIRIPFEEVKELIRGMNTFNFDRTLLPVPQKEQLNFCSEGNSINSFFDDLIKMAFEARKIALAVLIVAAILVMVPMAWNEMRRYRKMEENSRLFEKGHDAMDVVYLASRPHSSAWGLWFGQRFGSVNRQNAIRFAWAYATSTPMLFLLSLGLAGLFSCFCQYLLLKGVQAKVPELTDQVADFAEKVVFSLNNASMSWSEGVNSAIDKLDSEINEDIFGWVNSTTGAINGTLNAFVEKMSQALDDAFGNTPLHDPIKDVLNCLIGLKIESFQKGLTWVQEHAHVNFPGVKNDTFSLGALAQVSDSSSAVELLADPNGKAKDEITEANVYVNHDPYIINPAFVPDNANAEKATGNQEYPDTAAPPYEYPVNKAAPYTIQPRPFPTFGPTETVGRVDSHVVSEVARPGHLRASSHGTVADPSPLEEKRNPFDNRNGEKSGWNPFAG
ncbi:uncharacterized protein EI97DRAFT_384781 [Westerdykella ornata]|uniref:Plasma membrane fusion protein PRM1 n=1 Tax=Westerdykella ornata TaxID=318751 RepID=A0A6A6J940_WESOR|nr:uncharacterized protein EI97DRAFT_384781 [Westerdykella ornata]KAF2272912.1 hypothetical protein EI97DRAFT_384781 [Westerdykella ornata]